MFSQRPQVSTLDHIVFIFEVFSYSIFLIFIDFYMYIPHACLMPAEVRRGIRSPGTGVTDGWEPPCGCRELNSGPLEEQAMLLTSEPSLQPLLIVF